MRRKDKERMLRVWLLVVALASIVLCTPLMVYGETDPLLTDPNVQWVDIPESSGIKYATVTVTNVSKDEREVGIEWDYYADLIAGEVRAPKEWFTRFSPIMVLPPNVETVFNMTIDVPNGTEQGKYKAYIRVFDNTGYARHIVLWIRLGNFVPEYEYSLTKAKFVLTLDAPGVGIGTLSELGIKNTGNTDATYEISGRIPTDGADPEYEVAPYVNVDGESIDYEWLKIETPEIGVKHGEVGYPVVKVEIPSNITHGKYVMWVGVKCKEDSGKFVNIGYAVKVLCDINRQDTASIVSKPTVPWLVIGVVGVGTLLFGVYKIRKRMNGE